MKRICKLILFLFLTGFTQAQIGYTFSSLGPNYSANAGTVILGPSIDDGISASTSIGFTFQYGCINYTTFQASTNGVMFLGTAAAGSNLSNNLNTSADRPAIAPLWDDLKTGPAGNVNYKVTGVVGARILTIEWLSMLWNYSAATPVVSFEVLLFETSNRIEFRYAALGGAVNLGSASIGISGASSGDYYSLNNTTAAPVASKILETTTIATKPSNGRVYRWDPILCAGLPTPGAAVATPSLKCAAFTTTLTLSGATSACGLNYQWQSGPTVGGPWANIAGATSSTATAVVAATTFYRCVLACGASTAASTAAQASITPVGACGVCGITSITLPNTTAGTTCGMVNDLTSAAVTNVCGSASYYGGEDAVYSFIPATTGQITITYSTSGSSAGIMLYQGCPISGGTCVGNSQGISSFSGNVLLCANVTAGLTYYFVIDSWPAPACNPFNFSISAPTAAGAITCPLSTYAPTGIGYSFDAFVGTVLPTTDDVLFNTIVNFGFAFCYGGSQYWGGYVASNSAFVFDAVPCFPNILTNTYAAGGVSTGYTIPSPAPVNGTSIPRNAILAPWHDIHPGLGGIIRYTTLGIAPNRRFVASWESIPMFSCGTNSPAIYYTGQVKLFETTNNIEIHVGNKGVCPFNNGEAVLGLHNYNGSVYIPPVNATAHNAVGGAGPYNQWVMSNTAYRFSSPCAASGPCVTLPINFKAFYGQQIEATNKLNWETALEENISEYIIERSTDAINFIEIGRALPYNQPSKYDFKDATFKPNIINYYRITALEKDGNKKSTFTIPIGGNYEDINVSEIFPNPVKDNFTLSYNAKIETETAVIIKDMYGRIVKSTQHSISVGNTQTMINCPELRSGVYIVEISDATNSKIISQQKLIVVN